MDDPTRSEQGLVHPALPAGHEEDTPASHALAALDAAEAKRLRVLELLEGEERQDPADAMGDARQANEIRKRNREREDAAMAEAIDCGTGAVLDLVRALTYALVGLID